MDYNNIGEFFKHKLSQREFEMKDAYWKNAKQLIIQSNKKKKNKRVLFFILAILLLTTSLTWVFNFYNKSAIKSPAETVVVPYSMSSDVIPGEESPLVHGDKLYEEPSDTKYKPAVDSPASLQNTGDPPAPPQNDNSIVINEGTADEIEGNKVQEEGVIAANFESVAEKSPDVTVVVPSSISNAVIPGEEMPLAPKDKLYEESPDNKYKPVVDSLASLQNAGDSSASPQNDNNIIINEGAAGVKEDALSILTNKDTITTQIANQPDTTISIAKKSPFSLSLYGGILYVSKTLATNNQSYEKHVNRRKSEEQSILSYTVGIELNYRFKNWLLSSGITYNKLGEKINYSPNVSQQTDTIIYDNSYWRIATFSYWTTDSIGNPVFVQLVDSNYIEVINTADTTYTIIDSSIAEQNGITKLTYIEVPVLIGYEFHFKKLSVTVRTGVSFGYLMMAKGYYLNRTNEQLLNIATTPGLLNSFALNYLIRIGANYKWNETITLFAEPSLNVSINSVLQQQYGISQKYYTIGLNTGITYRF